MDPHLPHDLRRAAHRLSAGALLLALPVGALAHVPGAVPGTGGPLANALGLYLPVALAASLYALGLARLPASHGALRAAAFALGLGVLLLSLAEPLDRLAEHSFAAHMIQHELLMLAVAPLLVLGGPLPRFLWALPRTWRAACARQVRQPAWRRGWRRLTGTVSGWVLHAAALWLWHVPALFEAALRSPAIHYAQHATFLLTALVFWNGLLTARGTGRKAGAAVALMTTTIHTSLLGALLTFAPRVWYAPYAGEAGFSLAALEDQQLGGLIMWVPGSLVYVVFALVLLAQALRTDAEATAPGRTP